ncbi:hypothetical protein C2S53_006579 [Perilla frutescens var. hirtella]|uniref:Uncharacterized protein n=1 Tax=Perilla frutescens var. hirtella TaxID=608512 RepID=A0AAD4PD14_PERFH|nr:hypothetical protein C2S53_006579 [Perilla frutescens var. hirtella]
MQVDISICVEICRSPVEEASCSYVPDFEEFVPETEEHLIMVVDEFVPETEEASMMVVENFVPNIEDQVVMAMEIEAQGGDWRAEVANSMLQTLLPRYFELVRSNPVTVLVIFVGFAAYVIFVLYCVLFGVSCGRLKCAEMIKMCSHISYWAMTSVIRF